MKLQKVTKHLWRFRFRVKCVSVVSGGQVLFPIEMLMPVLMSLLFWEITHGIKILCL